MKLPACLLCLGIADRCRCRRRPRSSAIPPRRKTRGPMIPRCRIPMRSCGKLRSCRGSADEVQDRPADRNGKAGKSAAYHECGDPVGHRFGARLPLSTMSPAATIRCPTCLSARPTRPPTLIGMNGYIVNGNIHAHIILALGDDKGTTVSGHLEKGTRDADLRHCHPGRAQHRSRPGGRPDVSLSCFISSAARTPSGCRRLRDWRDRNRRSPPPPHIAARPCLCR